MNAMEQGEDLESVERLASLGLVDIDPDEPVEAENAFQHLPYVNAFIVETADRHLAERARAVLEEEEYAVAPDIALSAPPPAEWTPAAPTAEGSTFNRWPEISGVQLAHANGIKGKGVLVGVLDTGCDADHAEFRAREIEYRYVPLNTVSDSMRAVRGFDVDGHGTHVCGIIAGEVVGIAPEVELLVASTLESESLKTSLDRVLVGLDWMLSHFSEPENLAKPTIINMSLGFPVESFRLPPYRRSAELFRKTLRMLADEYGVLTVVAAGNDGAGKIRAPSFYPECLAVGALDGELVPAPFSGSGISTISGKPKPDISGFGVDIVSSYERTRGGRSTYARMSGTSMASPYVAGIAALYASARPELQGEVLRQRLISSAYPARGAPERVGAGLARYVQYGG